MKFVIQIRWLPWEGKWIRIFRRVKIVKSPSKYSAHWFRFSIGYFWFFFFFSKYKAIIYTKYHLFSLCNVWGSNFMDFAEIRKIAKLSPIEKFLMAHSCCNCFGFELCCIPRVTYNFSKKIFNCYLAVLWPSLAHCRRGSLTNPMLITAYRYLLDLKVTRSLVMTLGP